MARRGFERLEQLLSAQYARAGVQVVVRTLSVHHAPVLTGASVGRTA
jgi:hypothetical protein